MQKKIKLLHITSSLKIGGAETVLCDIIRKLGNIEFEHHVIYFHGGPNLEKIKNLGVTCYSIKKLICLYDPVFFVNLFFLVKKIKPDVIHSLLWSANVASRCVAKLLKIPNVSVYHNDTCIYGKFKKILDRATQGFSNYIVAVSDDVAISLGKISRNTKLVVIKNGLDTGSYIPPQGEYIGPECELHNSGTSSGSHVSPQGEYIKKNITPEELGIDQKEFIIGTVGRFSPEKNIELLIKSFAKICCTKKNVKLVLVGVGPQESYLRNLAHELNVENKVIFVVGKKASDYYSLFDVFVQPSAKEGMSIALLEAMSFELPCIVRNTCKSHPVIQDLENGLVVVSAASEDENAQALCDAILRVMEYPDFADNLAKNAKKTVLSKFDIESTISQYRELFARLAGKLVNKQVF